MAAGGGAEGVQVLLAGAGERYRLVEGGSVLGPGEGFLALLCRGIGRKEVFLVDVRGDGPVLFTVALPPGLERLEPRSLTLTDACLYLAGSDARGLCSVLRVALPRAGGPSLPAEVIGGPFASIGKSFASSPAAVAFLAGQAEGRLDVHVAGEAGPAVRLTSVDRGGQHDKVVPHDGRRPSLAVSGDGSLVAYNLMLRARPGRRHRGPGGEARHHELSKDPVEEYRNSELFIHAAAIPGRRGRRKVTSDALFHPYIEQESIILFDRAGNLLFAAGHDASTTDLFRLDGLAGRPINLTRTGSGLLPPFERKGTLSIDSVAVTPRAVLISASGLGDPLTHRVVGVDPSSGATLFEMPGLGRMAAAFLVGEDVYFTAPGADGAGRLFLLRDGSAGEVGPAAAGGVPGLLLRSKDRAIVLVPGTGLLDLEPGRERFLEEGGATGPVAMDPRERFFAFARPSGGEADYFVLDLMKGQTLPLAGGAAAGPLLALTEGSGFVRGDANEDGAVEFSDAVATLLQLMGGRALPLCPEAADSNSDGRVEVSDAVYTLQYLLARGPAPAAPFPGCGQDAAAENPCRGNQDCP